MMTLAPAVVSCSTMACPSPPWPPVTMATRPARLIVRGIGTSRCCADEVWSFRVHESTQRPHQSQLGSGLACKARHLGESGLGEPECGRDYSKHGNHLGSMRLDEGCNRRHAWLCFLQCDAIAARSSSLELHHEFVDRAARLRSKLTRLAESCGKNKLERSFVGERCEPSFAACRYVQRQCREDAGLADETAARSLGCRNGRQIVVGQNREANELSCFLCQPIQDRLAHIRDLACLQEAMPDRRELEG